MIELNRIALLNRGEPAIRFIRAVREYNREFGTRMQVVAFYTTPDAGAPFVRQADAAVCLGGAFVTRPDGTRGSTYCDHERVLGALRDAACDAVWPGWGFVSEDAAFVAKLETAGITFIGPPSHAMLALGDKIESKRLAERAGVPLARWADITHVEDERDLRALAEEVRYPLMVKASAGGGGRGIRKVRSPEALVEATRSARDEARSAFGHGGLFLEACVERARHVEVQLIVGHDGRAMAVGVRDCSIQRRNQKVIEESASCVLPRDLEDRLRRSSEAMAELAGYRGAGTAEFLFQPESGELVFLEVNSRLQVEHTVTEAVIGSDLVHAQLSVARGVPWAPTSQSPNGWAIEARLNAENPERGFAPSPGLVKVFRPPLGPGIRIDSGVVEGTQIAPEFDSMIAKVIAWGSTRAQAIARLVRGLSELEIVIENGSSNKAFLLELLDRPEYLSGGAVTTWLDEAMEQGLLRAPTEEFEALVAAGVLAYGRELEIVLERFFRQTHTGVPQNVGAPIGQSLGLRLRSHNAALHVCKVGPNRYMVSAGADYHRVEFVRTGEHAADLRIGEKTSRVLFSMGDASISVEVNGAMHTVEFASEGDVRAPAPAMVVDVLVAAGDVVRRGDRVCVLEAMKLEMPVLAETSGTVRQVFCRPNQQVSSGQSLLAIDAAGEADRETRSELAVTVATQSPAERLFDGDYPRADLLDNADPEFAAQLVEDALYLLRSVMLGYDVPPTTARRIGVLFSARLDYSYLRNPGRWLPLVELLQTFADTESLFDRSLVTIAGQPRGVSAQLAFYEFCRHVALGKEPRLEVNPGVHDALLHYDRHSSQTSPDRREYLWRLAVAHRHSELRHQLASSVLRLLIGLQEAAVEIPNVEGLWNILEVVSRVAAAEFPYVTDNANQATYVLFKQREYVSARDTLEDAIRSVMLKDSDASLERWANSSQSIAPLLFRVALDAGVDTGRVLRTLVLRHWNAGVVSVTEVPLANGAAAIRFKGTRAGVETSCIAAFCDHRSIAGTLDLVLGDRSSQSPLGLLELYIAPGLILGGVDAQLLEIVGEILPSRASAKQLTFVWRDSDDLLRYRTFELGAGAYVERADLRDCHPVVAERLEFWRYQEFELTRLPAPDRLHVFRGVARANPRDERIFVLAEVLGLERHESRSREPWPRWEFERIYFEAIRVIREAQVDRDVRSRLYRNRVSILIHRPIALDAVAVGDIAARLEGPTRRLGLEGVYVRIAAVDEQGNTTAREFVFSKPGRHRLDVQTRTPGVRPIAALTPYEQAVVLSRRLGYVYPYEIIAMLLGKGAEGALADLDVAGGKFEEFELDGEALAPVQRPAGKNTAGVVVGIVSHQTEKYPDGIARVWIASDPTRAMGALAEPECRRIVAALDLAELRGLPVEWLPVSAGARISMNSGTENLDWTASVLRRIIRFTDAGGEINVIVTGVNVGAQSYWNAEATMLMHTRGVLVMTPAGSMVLTGKKALEYSGSVAAEDEIGIGGADRIMGPNGQAQYVASDLGGAYRILFQHYHFTYCLPGESGPRRLATVDVPDRDIAHYPYAPDGESQFNTIGEIFDDRTNPGRKKPFSIRNVMGAVVDSDGGTLERWQPMRAAETSVVWDAHIGGIAATVIGIESRPLPRFGRVPADGPETWSGGTLYPQSSKKVARAINAASGNRPVVVLANLSGFDGSPESLRELQLEYGAEIGRAVTRFSGRIVFVVIGRYHGGAYVVFSKSLNPNLRSIALEGTFASVIGGAPAAAVVFTKDVEKRALADARVVEARRELDEAPLPRKPRLRVHYDSLLAQVILEKQGELAKEFDAIHTVERAVRVGSLDAVVSCAGVRGAIIDALSEPTA